MRRIAATTIACFGLLLNPAVFDSALAQTLTYDLSAQRQAVIAWTQIVSADRVAAALDVGPSRAFPPRGRAPLPQPALLLQNPIRAKTSSWNIRPGVVS